MIRRLLAALVALIVLAIVGVLGWLLLAPPELLRVADGYAAKIICSNVFLAGRDPQQVLDVDVTAAGNPLLKYIKQSVDHDAGTATARMLGFIAPMTAVYRPGLGCTLAADGNVDAVRKIALATPPAISPLPDAPWPEGNGASTTDPRIDSILDDPKMTGPGMRAVVVVKDGRIIGERYGQGFDQTTPLLGWSMTKTLNGVLLGMTIGDGRLSLADKGLFAGWGDGRKDITLAELASMESGMVFEEDYGEVTDVTRMLYLEPDMAGFTEGKALMAQPGSKFSYATGIGMELARLWMDKQPDAQAALNFPRERLFGPLGMTTAVLETDEAGTFAGGSYGYASGRDWARLGQFLLQDGMWNGQQLLPANLVTMMETGNGYPGGYSEYLTWLEGPMEDDKTHLGLPHDTFWMIGHDGQSAAIIPSAKLVVVRMGLTPKELGWGPEAMVKAIVAALSN